MNTDIDFNGNRAINLGEPFLPHHAVTLNYLETILGLSEEQVNISSNVVISTGSITGRTLADRFAEEHNINDFFVAGEANYNNAWDRVYTVARTTTKPIRFTGGQTYSIGPKTISHENVHVKLDDTAVWKFISPGATTSTRMVYITASNCSIVGGTFDYDKDSIDRAAYNAGGGAGSIFSQAIRVGGTSGTHISNVKVHTKIKNSADFALYSRYVDNIDYDIQTDGCGAGVSINNSIDGIVHRVVHENMDQDLWRIYAHGNDFYFNTGLSVGPLINNNQAGYGTVAGLTSMSDWVTNLTIIGCDNCTFGRIIGSVKADTTLMKSVGISIMSSKSCSFSNVTTKRYSSVHLELATSYQCHFSNFHFDNQYQSLGASTEATNGIHFIPEGFYDDITRRAMAGVRECRFSNGTVARMFGKGVNIFNAYNNSFANVKFQGCEIGGQTQPYNGSTSGLTINQAPYQSPSNNIFNNCEFDTNEVCGFRNLASDGLIFNNCIFKNNGQAKSNADTLRRGGASATTYAGYVGIDAATVATRNGVVFNGCTFEDDQVTATDKNSASPDTPTQLTVKLGQYYRTGQYLTLTNAATGPANLTTYITDINEDEVTLATAMTNFPLTAGAGTILTSGTTVTGTSTAFNTHIDIPTWLKYGTEYRLLYKTSSNTAGTLLSAFSSDINPTAAYDRVNITATPIRCQNYAIITSNSNDNGITINSPYYGANGNVLGGLSLAGTAIINEGINPRDFGAKMDGTTDDTAAMTAAINANMGDVALYGGTLRTTGTLTLAYEGQKLLGHGATIYTDFATNAPAVRMQKHRQGVVGCKLLGTTTRKTTGNTHDRGILYEAADTANTAAFNGMIAGNEISNQGGDAICVVGFSASTIQGNYIHDCYGNAVRVDSGYNTGRTNIDAGGGMVTIFDNAIKDIRGHALLGGGNNEISGGLSNAVFRVFWYNNDSVRCATTPGVRKSRDNIWLFGTNCEIKGCGIGGFAGTGTPPLGYTNPATGAVRAAGQDIVIESNRIVHVGYGNSTSVMQGRPALAIGSTPANVANGAFDYMIAGVIYSKAAVAAGTAPGNDVIPLGKYGAVAFDIDSAGTITAIEAPANATGYTTAFLAEEALPDPGAGLARMGWVTAMKSDGTFTFGTTSLAAANTTVAYTDNLTYCVYLDHFPAEMLTSRITVDNLRMVADSTIQMPVVAAVLCDNAVTHVTIKNTKDQNYILRNVLTRSGIYPVGMAWEPLQMAIKLSDETVNNSAVVQADDELYCICSPLDRINFEASINYISSAAADFKLAVNTPAGATLEWITEGGLYIDNADAVQIDTVTTASGTGKTYGGAATTRNVKIRGYCHNGSTNGFLRITWAQGTATAVDTKVLKGSTFKVYRE